MSNSSRHLYQTFIKKGKSKEDAFFSVLDHFCELHCFDRNYYQKIAAEQDARIEALERGQDRQEKAIE